MRPPSHWFRVLENLQGRRPMRGGRKQTSQERSGKERCAVERGEREKKKGYQNNNKGDRKKKRRDLGTPSVQE